jgi:hypothetical protein
LAESHSFIIDTTTIKTYKPQMAHGEFDVYGHHFWNAHKKCFGIKIELAVAMQRRPVPLAASVVPAGWSDIATARLPGGIVARMYNGERALGDPGYHGEVEKIYAPPKRNMMAYIQEVDKEELTLQRRVEMCDAHLKQFKCLGSTYRKGAVRALRDLELIGIVVSQLVYLDLMLNQDISGHIHTLGPSRENAPSARRSKRVCTKRVHRTALAPLKRRNENLTGESKQKRRFL